MSANIEQYEPVYMVTPMEQTEQVKQVDNALSVQIGGDHYKNFKIQPIEFIHANNLDFLQGSIIKYVSRFRNKNGRTDLEKARHFIDLLIQLEYGNESKD